MKPQVDDFVKSSYHCAAFLSRREPLPIGSPTAFFPTKKRGMPT